VESLHIALACAQEREAATREILEVVSDYLLVFDAILSNAAQLCRLPPASLALVAESKDCFSVAAI
jgi:hypothetical protein